MAKKRKKKKTQIVQGKKNEKKKLADFLTKLIKITCDFGSDDVLNKIPKSHLLTLYKSRFHNFRVEKAEGSDLTDHDIKVLNNVIKEYISSKPVEIFTDQTFEITFDEFLVSGLSLLYFLKDLNKDSFVLAHEVLDIFKPFTELYRYGDAVKDMMEEFSVYPSWMFSYPGQGYFRFRYDLVINHDKTKYVRYLADVIKPEIKHITVHGQSRKAYRVSYFQKAAKLKPATIKAANIGASNAFGNLELDVYIQQHALERMKERLDSYKFNEENLFFFFSVREPVIVQNSKGQYLLVYGEPDKRIGYFVIEPVDGVALLTTFLFLTNDGTPEGEKLRSLAGIEKADKKYLKIDRLSAFAQSDIEQNEAVKKIFIKAGCGGLFDLFFHIHPDKNNLFKRADALLKYLEL